MQDGSITIESRKRGPDVWCFRWREPGPDGRRIHRRIVLGTAADLKSFASASKMAVGPRHEINHDIRLRRESITFADLSRHYQQRELADRNSRIAYSTEKAYAGYLEKWIEPRWGRYGLSEIRATEVELWLRDLDRAPGTRSKIRNTMSLLFNHGRRHDLCERNPIQWVRQSAKRRAAPDVLTTCEVQKLLESLVEALQQWRSQTNYKSLEDWLFASPVHRGRWPYLAQQIMGRHIFPVARKLGINKRISWHTFRHTYSTLLRSTGA